jgi:D-alanyl-D-alanine dipeptidase
MPTEFDDFSKLADRDYSDCSEESVNNALLLENLMKKHGFKPYYNEWWHYTDTDSYPVEKTFNLTNTQN